MSFRLIPLIQHGVFVRFERFVVHSPDMFEAPYPGVFVELETVDIHDRPITLTYSALGILGETFIEEVDLGEQVIVMAADMPCFNRIYGFEPLDQRRQRRWFPEELAALGLLPGAEQRRWVDMT